MVDIQNLLQQLLSAVYGKDVRQAIHDAIHQCYADGLAARENISQLQEKIGNIPTVTDTDNGKFLRVVNGVWSAVALTDVSEVGA